MTKDQVNLLKQSYMKEAKKPNGDKGTTGEYMKFCLDGGIDMVTSKDLVIFDDEHNLLHCICPNEDFYSQADFPVKIISSQYEMVQELETIMSQKNFEQFLEDGFISNMINDEQKEFIINWSKTIKNQAIQPMEAEPYFNTNPDITPMPTKRIERDDT